MDRHKARREIFEIIPAMRSKNVDMPEKDALTPGKTRDGPKRRLFLKTSSPYDGLVMKRVV